MENATTSSQNNVKTPSIRPENWPIESQEHLIISSKQKIFQKVPKKLRDCFLAALALVVAITIFTLLVLLALKSYAGFGGVCSSPECIRSADNLLQSMNASVNPCDNFYKFVCDNWRVEHVMAEPRFMNTWFEERNKLIIRDILEFLEQENKDDEPLPVHQARTVYDACLDFESINDKGLDVLWRVLDDLGLPRLPPTVSEEPSAISWIRILGKIKRYLGKDLLIGFNIMTSLKNSTLNQLIVSTTDETDTFLRRRWVDLGTETFLERNLQKGSVDVIRLWKEFSTKLMGFLVEKSNYTAPDLDRTLALSSLRILQMMQNISQIESSEEIIGPYLNDIPDEMKLSDLQELVDNSTSTGESKILWETYFDSVFEDIEDVTLNFTSDRILVYKKEYYVMLSEFLEYLSEKDLELLLWWEVVYALAPHVHEELKTLKDVYTAKVLSAPQRDTRPTECVKLVYTFMDPALAYLAMSKFDFTLVDTISEMITNIQEAFIQFINDLSWMDKATKEATVTKIRSMRRFLGIPDWMSDKDELESMYNITVNETTHLDNLLSIMSTQMFDVLSALRTENNNSISQFNPLDINAYYDPSGNAISVPAGIMQFPFYDLGLEALNYGAIGTILGHEMSHGLDSYGRRFDLNGNLNNKWWSNASTAEYERRTACYVKSYSSYYIPSVNGTVNGNTTLAENLADDGGIRNAFHAYKMYTDNFQYVEPKLPGLEKYSHKQLFFMAHANMWCSEYTEAALSETLDYDEHSPQFVRVNRVMQNMPEFAKAWGCPRGSKMNPKEKCKMWLD